MRLLVLELMTASTPIPLDDRVFFSFDKKFEDNLSAMAWLWKDYTSIAEAKEITELAQSIRQRAVVRIHRNGTGQSITLCTKFTGCI